jgi:hypothetical protein
MHTPVIAVVPGRLVVLASLFKQHKMAGKPFHPMLLDIKSKRIG